MSMETRVKLIDVVKLDRSDVVLDNQKYLNDGYDIITYNSSLKKIVVPQNANFWKERAEVVSLIKDTYNTQYYSSFENDIVHDLKIISLCNQNLLFTVQFEFPEYEADSTYRLHILNGKTLHNGVVLKFQYSSDDDVIKHLDMIP